MTRKQSVILWLGITIILLMTMFPPILKTVPAEGSDGSSYRQIIEYEYYFTKSVKKILLQRLFMEWFVVAIITVGLLYTYKSRPDTK